MADSKMVSSSSIGRAGEKKCNSLHIMSKRDLRGAVAKGPKFPYRKRLASSHPVITGLGYRCHFPDRKPVLKIMGYIESWT